MSRILSLLKNGVNSSIKFLYSGTMTQAIRNFAKTLENWMTAAMLGFPEEMVVIKISIVSALAQTLRRYTSLNHLAQAARAVLQNQTQITQMLSDLNRVDFHTVTEQVKTLIKIFVSCLFKWGSKLLK